MTMLRVAQKIVLFVHIPKTGGTTIEDYYRTIGRLSIFSRNSWGLCPPQHWDAEIINDLIPPEFYDYAFAVVRHPYDRVLSEYKYRCDLGSVDPARTRFSDWFSAAAKACRTDPRTLQNHMRPQAEFLFADVEVFKFERGLGTIIADVDRKLEVMESREIPHSKRGGERVVQIGESDLQLVREFYERDFYEFSYDPSFDEFYDRQRGRVTRDDVPTYGTPISRALSLRFR